VDSSGSLATLMGSLDSASPQRAATSGSLRQTWSGLAAAPDPYNFTQTWSSPRREFSSLSAVLLEQRGNYKETMYGAFIPESAGTYFPSLSTGVVPDASTNGTMCYAIMHNTSAYHGAPTFVNVINSALYSRVTPGGSIKANSHPLPETFAATAAVQSGTASTVAIIVVIAFSFIPAAVTGFVVRERETGSKSQQLLAGVSIPAYWITTFAWDVLLYLITGLVSIGIVYGLGGSSFSKDRHRLDAIAGIFILYGPAVISFSYLLHFAFRSAAAASGSSLLLNASCIILVTISFLLSVIPAGCPADLPLRWIFRLVPGYDLGNALQMIASLDILPLLYNVCYPSSPTTRVYDALDMDVAGANIVYLGTLSVGYLVLTILIDTALTSPAIRGYLEAPPRHVTDAPCVEDEDVAAEKARVSATLSQGERGDASRVIQIAGLRKVFRTLEGPPKVAVRDLWLGLEVGDVFGFLGVNGAGESAWRAVCSPYCGVRPLILWCS
jgi:ATP-binding cassette, subfamily A (ABC1), member 3